jgi:tetratricopeptide (TPR) repeat protein
VGAQSSLLPFLLFLPFYILIAINYKKPWARGLLLGLTAYLFLNFYGLTAMGAFLDGSLAHENHFQYIALPVIIALVVCSFGGIAHNMGSAGRILWCLGFTLFAGLQLTVTASYAYTLSDRAQMWYHVSEQWPEAWRPKLALIHTIQESGQDSVLLTQSEIIKMLEDILDKQPDLVQERKLLTRIYRNEGQNTNALRHYKRILRDSKPDNDFLLEAADFYDELGLSWDANNARERITE